MARQKTGRMCTAEEVAYLCVYLASDEVRVLEIFAALFILWIFAVVRVDLTLLCKNLNALLRSFIAIALL